MSDERHPLSSPPSVNGVSTIHPSARRLLDALARHAPLAVTRAQLATLSDFTARGGAYNGHFGALKRAGLIAEAGDDVTLTDAGYAALGIERPREPASVAERIDLWRGALPDGPRRLFEALIEEPRGLTREQLAAHTGFTASGGAFNGHLGMLRRNGLVTSGGSVVRLDAALLEGVVA